MARKRRSNFALARRSASSGSTSRCRAQFATANSRSPSSSARRASSPIGHVFDFAQLLFYLGAHALRIRPVEPHAPGPFAKLRGARQRRQRQRHIGEFARAALPRAARSRALCSSQARFCSAADVDARIREHVRMPLGEFVGDGVGHAREIEPLPLRAHLRVKHHLEQQVAELAFERAAVRRARWPRRLRRPLRWCTARCSRSPARDPRGSRSPDRAVAA